MKDYYGVSQGQTGAFSPSFKRKQQSVTGASDYQKYTGGEQAVY